MNPANASEPFRVDQYILHHVADAQQWNLPFIPPIDLPPFLSLHMLNMFICAIVLIVVFCFLYRKQDPVPKGLTNVLEQLIVFIRDQIAVPSLGKEDGRRLTPLLCTFFFFILLMNLIGLVPSFATATSNVNVTAGLALVTLGFMIFGAIARNGVGGFFKALTPSGVPTPILVILFPIEFLGLFIKAVALMIRLFANMIAGHIVILALLSLVVMLGWVALPVVVLAVFISVLEVFVCFLQAYVFTLLSALFIGQLCHAEH